MGIILAFPKTSSRSRAPRPRRLVCPAHLAYVASLPCAVPGCGRAASVHHLRVKGADAAAGRRAGDNFAVPVCQPHHQGVEGIHHYGHESKWWRDIGVDPLALAAQLWAESHGGPMP